MGIQEPSGRCEEGLIIELFGLDVRFKKVARDGVRDPEVSSEAENMS